MGLLSKLPGDSEDDEVEEEEPDEEEEQEEEEPETETWVELETEITGTQIRKVAEIQFTSGRTEEVEYYNRQQNRDQRVYQTVSEATATLNCTLNGNYYSYVECEYEPVKEITLGNVETIEVVEEVEETFSDELKVDRHANERLYSGLIEFVEAHEDGEVYEKEVTDDGSAE